MEIKAYAKLNLILNVKGKREDGFHEIETVFQAIDLYDRVIVVPADKDDIGFLPTGKYRPRISKDSNLALKALFKAKEVFKRDDNYFVSIEKNIPLSGGLGGGSADAAAVLSALARIWEMPWEEMLPLAGSLGSDVPFCLASQNGHPAAIGRGRGEILEYIEPLKARIHLKRSNIHIKSKTASVYGALIPEDYLVQYDVTSFMKEKSLEGKLKHMGNHLQKAFERLTGEEVPKGWILCGAGPTYFRFSEDGKYETVTK